MSHPPFLPIGLPRDASPGDTVDERVGLHLLETLEALDAVYKSATWFARVGDASTIGEFALQRCLDGACTDTGALFLVDDTGLVLAAERNGAAGRLRVEELVAPDLMPGPRLWNDEEAARLLESGHPPTNLLTSPIQIGDALAGIVVLLGTSGRPFSTGDAKLIASVASQAAIALGRARHLRESELERQKLDLVVQGHPEGIAMLDRHGATTLCNPIARELLGTGDVLERLHAADPTCTLHALAQAPAARELTVAGPRGTRVLGVESRPCGAGEGAGGGIVVTLRDLTRQRHEERLNRNFVSLLSHKLRTPLTSLLCALELSDGAAPDERAMFVAEMKQRAMDLGRVIERLAQFTDLLEGSWATHDSTDLERTRHELDAHYAESPPSRGIDLHWDLAADAPRVPVPAPRLRVALQNLIDNAVKFTPGRRPWVRVTSRRVHDAVVLEVEDRGPGIPATDRGAVLDAFHQLDGDFTGNVAGAGVGLAMVREIVRRLGGRLALREAKPHGCVFSLSFSLAATTSPATSPPRPAGKAGS